MQNILIIGATSTIAEHCARIYASRGARLCLLGRDSTRLESIAEDLQVRGATDVHVASLDVLNLSDHPEAIEFAWRSLERVDIALIAHGTLPNQTLCDDSVEMTVREFNTNATATISLMTAVLQKFTDQAGGSLTLISSVAGDRGRSSNYLYGAAKAAVSTFASGVRQKYFGKGIHIQTVKPGFVNTKMTAPFKKGLLWAEPTKVARDIVTGIDRGRSVTYTPYFWTLIMFLIKATPEFIFKRIKL